MYSLLVDYYYGNAGKLGSRGAFENLTVCQKLPTYKLATTNPSRLLTDKSDRAPKVFTCFSLPVLGDSLSYHNGLPFTTKDRDNDRHYHGRNCAEDDRGAWWYNSCQLSNLNGRYFAKPTTTHQGINWYTWKRSFYSMKEVTMKLAHNSL